MTEKNAIKIFSILCILGILTRIYLFSFNRTLWLDEAYLANAVTLAGWKSILTEPLGNNQAAPLGFVILVKLSVLVMGLSDWVLRLWPFLFGIASVWVAERLGALLFERQSSKWFLAAAISLSPVLIYYSTEFKQYSVDVFFTLLLTYAMVRVTRERETAFLGLTVAASIAVWFSYPSVIVIAAAYFSILFAMVFKVRSMAFKPFLYSAALVAVSFLLIYLVAIKGSSSNGNLINFWHDAYAPIPWGLENIAWYGVNLLGLTHLTWFHLGIAGHLPLVEWSAAANKLALIVFMGSLFALYKKNRVAFVCVATILALALLLSMLKFYPFRSRLILYLVPLVVLSGAYLLDYVLTEFESQWGGIFPKIALFFALIVLMHGAYLAVKKTFEPYNYSDSKSLIKDMAEMAPGAPVVLSSWSNHAFDFYKRSYQLEALQTISYTQTRNPEKDHKTILKLLCENSSAQIWILFSHRFDEQSPIIEKLRHEFSVKKELLSFGAGAFLISKDLGHACIR